MARTFSMLRNLHIYGPADTPSVFASLNWLPFEIISEICAATFRRHRNVIHCPHIFKHICTVCWNLAWLLFTENPSVLKCPLLLNIKTSKLHPGVIRHIPWLIIHQLVCLRVIIKHVTNPARLSNFCCVITGRSSKIPGNKWCSPLMTALHY